METPSFDDFALFIRQQFRVPLRKEIVPETEFERDLGITGDDGIELLVATEKRFNITLLSKDGCRGTFNLAPNEFLFHPEGFGPSLPDLLCRLRGTEPLVVTFTVGALYSVVKRALTIKGSHQ